MSGGPGPQDPLILALDLGSSALKAVLFDGTGGVVAQAESPCATQSTPDGGQEQDPEGWWAATMAACAALPAALRARVAAVVPVGTMENLIALDAEGAPLRPALLYSDARGAASCAAAASRLAALGAAAILGNAPEPLMTVFKLAWLREAEPATAARIALVLPGAKDVLGLRLSGQAATDPTTATTAGLMEIARRDWSPALCDALAVDPALLPPIRPSDAVLGAILPQAALRLGLPEGCVLVNGCGDAGASTLGAGAVAGAGIEGGASAHLYLGTTGWVARPRPLDPAILPRPVYTLAHPDAGEAIEIAPILSAGDAAAWFGRIAGSALPLLDGQAAAVDAAPPDALFLPYLKGERSPFVDLALRGAFIGLDAAHGRAALHYAVLEGVAFALRANLEALGGAGRLLLTGGGAASRIWPQLIADVTGAAVEIPELPAATTAFGGFRLAARALGWPDPPQPAARRHAPRPERRARADARYALFRRVTADLRGLPAALG